MELNEQADRQSLAVVAYTHKLSIIRGRQAEMAIAIADGREAADALQDPDGELEFTAECLLLSCCTTVGEARTQ